MTEQELRQIEAAIRNEVADTLQRGRLIATIRSAAADLITPPERPGERLQREREAAEELMASGYTPMAVARKLAADRHDPNECETLAQRFRAQRRRKKNAQCA